ncbi:MAG: hypothetical protein KME30_21765 [Iphinoe sp. HA4291-MV1]|jgi:hypothetical protein|nr:hypothetical protein [Iphinoe sp. HA4291-MV1]
MRIDEYDEAIALTEKLKETLPMTVRAGKQFLKVLKEQGEKIDPDREYTIDYVGYSGDEGGIMCTIAVDPNQPNNKERHFVSITHLKIDPNHPLASEVQAYQRQRIRKLMLQNQGGFAAEVMILEPGKKKNRGKGFGK